MATVEYGKTFNLGNYENERIFFEDDVQPGETPEEAFERVKAFVLARHGEGEQLRSLEERRYEIDNEITRAKTKGRQVVSQWRDAVKRFNELRELLAQHGVQLAPLDRYYLPPEEQPQAVAVPAGDEDEDDGAEDDEDPRF